ncbi:MAG: multidrug transporter subunit MdtA [Acidobacteria bacterium]|nr:MAG: multidrug transporter subunit MdtA [Acidobacteriota bacterium]
MEPRPELETHEPPGAGPRSNSRWWLWLLVIAALGYGVYRLQKGSSGQQTSPAGSAARSGRSGPRSVPVVAAPARQGDVPIYLRGLGSVTAYNTVTVKSRVDGQLVHVQFREGQFVHPGDLLAEIDRRPYEVQLSQVQGQLARDQAQLNDAKVNLDRAKALYADGIIPKQQLDTQAALVGQYQGAMASDQAQIDAVNLNLVYCRILAPIGGRVGLRLVDEGNMVHAADPNGLVVITQVQPIAVVFSLPQDNLPPVLKKLRAGNRLRVEAYDRDGKALLAAGSLLTVDNQMDPSTGTYRLKAVFDNANNALFPNQFVNVKLLLDTERGAVIVPSAAIQRGPQGTFLYVVKPNQTAEVRPVAVGIIEGDNTSIARGLAPNELVVVDGMDKLQDGSKVEVRASNTDTGGRRPGA